MANREPSRGIYADLAAKRAAKYDVELEGRVRAWIEGVVGRPIPGNFREGLMDGTIVCELVNKLQPGTIVKIHKSPIVMFRRENFGFFQNACVKLGCVPNETAVFEDVYEDRNMGQFLTNIVALARCTQYKPGYKGPILADASKEAQGAAGPGPVAQGKYIGTYQEEANKTVLAAKEASRYTEHGIISNPDDHKFHGQKAGDAPAPAAQPAQKFPNAGKYLGTFQDAATEQALKAKEAGRYTEHGIISNPDDHKFHGQKGPQ
jgi:hypothetical protein